MFKNKIPNKLPLPYPQPIAPTHNLNSLRQLLKNTKPSPNDANTPVTMFNATACRPKEMTALSK